MGLSSSCTSADKALQCLFLKESFPQPRPTETNLRLKGGAWLVLGETWDLTPGHLEGNHIVLQPHPHVSRSLVTDKELSCNLQKWLEKKGL